MSPVDPTSVQSVYQPPVVKPCKCAENTSLITGILSYLCFPFVLGIVAIISGVFGRKRAKQEARSKAVATIGMWLGIVNVVLSTVLLIIVVIAAASVFNNASNAVTTVRALTPAIVAADSYGTANGSFNGISTEALATYGYTPPAGVEVSAKALANGSKYCIQATPAGDPNSTVHVTGAGLDLSSIDPQDLGTDQAGSALSNLNIGSYTFSQGPCPTS